MEKFQNKMAELKNFYCENCGELGQPIYKYVSNLGKSTKVYNIK